MRINWFPLYLERGSPVKSLWRWSIMYNVGAASLLNWTRLSLLYIYVRAGPIFLNSLSYVILYYFFPFSPIFRFHAALVVPLLSYAVYSSYVQSFLLPRLSLCLSPHHSINHPSRWAFLCFPYNEFKVSPSSFSFDVIVNSLHIGPNAWCFSTIVLYEFIKKKT